MPARTLVIVNPRSRSGATGRRWREVETHVRDALGALEVEFTRGPRDAERIAREGVRAGAERLVVAGGDGTASEVVTGILGADLGGYVCLALLPLGTGSDLARTLGVPRDLEAALRGVRAGKLRRIDAGLARYRSREGREVTSYFLNVASVGLSGLVTALVDRSPGLLGARLSYLLATLRALGHWRSVPVTLRVDGATVHEGPLVLAAVANGRCFGGGMRVAPQADPEDGVFDVVVVPGMPRRRLLRHLGLVYRGEHLGVAGVALHRGQRIEAASAHEVWIEVDGEPLGTLPASFELVPRAVSLLGVEPA